MYLISILGIDELFFLDDPHAVASYAPGRMAPNTAFGLLYAVNSFTSAFCKKERLCT
jgi:hypothetical protein